MMNQCRFFDKGGYVATVLCQSCIDRLLPATMQTNRGRRMLRFRHFREQERYFSAVINYAICRLFMFMDDIIAKLPTNSAENDRVFVAIGALTYKGAQIVFGTLTTRADATKDLIQAMLACYNTESQKASLPPLPLMLLGKGTHVKFVLYIRNSHKNVPSILSRVLPSQMS